MIENATTLFDIISDPKTRLALISTPGELQKVHSGYRTGASSIFVADVNISPLHLGFFSAFEIKDVIANKTFPLIESGIFLYLWKNIINPSGFESKVEEIGPQVLTMQHLKAGFVVCIVLMSLAVTAFAVECASREIGKLFRMCLACHVVVKFVRMKRML
jgi:hypothetical protein